MNNTFFKEVIEIFNFQLPILGGSDFIGKMGEKAVKLNILMLPYKRGSVFF